MRNQQGAMSFLTVIFLAIILSIVTLSFVRISTTEQRQAVDDDLTTRAFYAAESGIEDAKRAIAEYQNGSLNFNQLNADICTPATILSGELNTDLDAEYTCQFIELNPDNYQDDLDPWESVTIPLRGLSNFSQVRISWHIPNLDGDIAARTGAQNLPNADEWVANDFAAMLRTTVVDTPSGNFNQSQVSSQTGFLNPHASGGSASLGSGFDGDILNADCDDSISSGYACTITVSGFNSLSPSRYLHLQSLYRGTHVQVELIGTQFDEVQAIVDVTGRAGDVFRRVEARVSLIEDRFDLPDVAVWSNEEICKNFTVTDNPAHFNAGDCDWATGGSAPAAGSPATQPPSGGGGFTPAPVEPSPPGGGGPVGPRLPGLPGINPPVE